MAGASPGPTIHRGSPLVWQESLGGSQPCFLAPYLSFVNRLFHARAASFLALQLTQDARCVSWAYLLALRETIIGEMLHITGFRARENELRHPLSNDGRELKTVPTDRKVLSPLDFLAYSWLVRHSNMEKNELPAILSWTYYNDGTSDPPPLPKSEPSQEPKEPPKYDYDKLIAESTGLYRDWWILWKRIHPEWALLPEEPKEPIIKAPPTAVHRKIEPIS